MLEPEQWGRAPSGDRNLQTFPEQPPPCRCKPGQTAAFGKRHPFEWLMLTSHTRCRQCGGTGERQPNRRRIRRRTPLSEQVIPSDVLGKIRHLLCPACGGTGWIRLLPLSDPARLPAQP